MSDRLVRYGGGSVGGGGFTGGGSRGNGGVNPRGVISQDREEYSYGSVANAGSDCIAVASDKLCG